MSAFRFIAEEVFSLPGRGVVVTGRVEEGTISVGEEIGFLGTEGRWTGALVTGIEVSRHLVEEAKAGQRASLLLEGVRKDQITLGTILMEMPAAPAPIAPVESQPAPPPPASGSSSQDFLVKAIHPSSGLWNTVLIIIIGVLILFMIYFLGWEP